MYTKFGANTELARLASLEGATPQIWVVPGNGGLCLFVRYSADDGGSTCQASSGARAGYLNILRSNSDGSTTVIGLAPDSVADAHLETSTGTVNAPVANNIYAFNSVTGGKQLVVGAMKLALP